MRKRVKRVVGWSMNVESPIAARDLKALPHRHQPGQTCRHCRPARQGVEVGACWRCGGAVHHRVGLDGPEAVCLNCAARPKAAAMPKVAGQRDGRY